MPSDGDDDSNDDNNGSQFQRQPPVPHWQPHCPLPDDFQRHHKLKEIFYHQYTATHLSNYLKLWDEGNVIWHRYHYCTLGQRQHVNKNSDLVYKSPEAFRQKLETSCASSLESFSCLPARYIFIIYMFWFVKFVKLQSTSKSDMFLNPSLRCKMIDKKRSGKPTPTKSVNLLHLLQMAFDPPPRSAMASLVERVLLAFVWSGRRYTFTYLWTHKWVFESTLSGIILFVILTCQICFFSYLLRKGLDIVGC